MATRHRIKIPVHYPILLKSLRALRGLLTRGQPGWWEHCGAVHWRNSFLESLGLNILFTTTLSLHCYYAPEGTYILNERNQTFPLTMPPLDGVIIKLKTIPNLFQYKQFNWPAREFNIINKSKNISQEPPWAQLSSTIQWYWILRVHKCRLNIFSVLPSVSTTFTISCSSKPLSWRSS